MKRWLVYLLAGTISFAGVGGGTVALMASNNNENPSTLPDDDDDDRVLSDVELTPQDRFMTNLLAGNLKVNNLDVSIDTGAEKFDIGFTGGLSYDGAELAKGNLSAISASGDLSFKGIGFDETISFAFPGNSTLYFSYAGKDFYVTMYALNSILDLIPLFTQEDVVENAENLNKNEVMKASGFDLSGLLENATDLLTNIVSEETEDGYNYYLEIPDLTTIILKSTKDDLLKGIELTSPITIDGITIDLSADVYSSKDESFVEQPNGSYQSLDTIVLLVETIKELSTSKQVTANIDVSAKSVEDNSLDLDLHAKLGADFTNVTDDFLKGTYELSILPEGTIQGGPQLNSIDIHYEQESLFFKINELLKGKLSNQTISDIIEIVSENIDTTESSESINTMLEELFGGSALMDLINGEYTAIKSMLSDFNSSDEAFVFNFSEKFLNTEAPFTLSINFEEEFFKSIAIEGLVIKGYAIDFTLEIEKSFSSAAIFEDLTQYKDYRQGLSIYDSIAEILDTKQFATDYKIDLMNKDDFYSFSGEIAADLSNVDFNDLKTLLNGEFKLSAKANYNGKEKYVEASLVDEAIYLNYNNIIKNSVQNASITELIDFISSKVGSDTPVEEEPAAEFDLNEVLTFLSFNVDEVNEIIEECKKFNFKVLDDYILIDKDNTDENILNIKILPSKNSEAYIVIEISTEENALKSLKIQNLKLGEVALNFELNIKKYSGIAVDSTLYQPLDSLISNVEKLINTTKFNMSIDASIVDDDSSVDPITLAGNVQADIETMEIYGNLDLSAKLPTDSAVYNHHITFDNHDLGNNLGNELLLKYYGNNNSSNPMRLFMANSEFGSIIDIISNIPEDNSLIFLFKATTDLTISMPLLDIINGQYGLLFNDYLKTFAVTSDSTVIEIDGELFGMDTDLNLQLTYNDNGITGLAIKDLRFGSKTINLNIKLNNYDESLKASRLSVTEPTSKHSYINANYLDLFLQIGINTTQSRNYHLNGQFNLSFTSSLASLIQKPIYSAIDMKIVINEPDGNVNALISLTKTDENGNIINPNADGYKRTEFYIQSNNDCIIKQTRVSSSWQLFGGTTYTRTVDIFRVTQAEMLNNIVYYVFKYSLDLSDTIYDPINDAIKNPSTDTSNSTNILNFKYENIIEEMYYDEDARKFTLTIDLNNIVKLENVAAVLKQDKISISITHDENNTLNTLTISGTPLYIDIGIAKIGVVLYLNVFYRADETFSMQDFHDFCDAYYADPVLSNMQYYEHDLENTGAIYTITEKF